MDRRSFVMALFGGLAAAGVGGIAASEAAQPKLTPVPTPDPAKAPEELSAEAKDGLDKADTEFSQYYYYRRPRYRRYYYRRPRYYYRPRRVYRRRYYY